MTFKFKRRNAALPLVLPICPTPSNSQMPGSDDFAFGGERKRVYRGIGGHPVDFGNNSEKFDLKYPFNNILSSVAFDSETFSLMSDVWDLH